MISWAGTRLLEFQCPHFASSRRPSSRNFASRWHHIATTLATFQRPHFASHARRGPAVVQQFRLVPPA